MEKVAEIQRAMEAEVAEIKRIEAGKCVWQRPNSLIRVPQDCGKQAAHAGAEEWERDGPGWV